MSDQTIRTCTQKDAVILAETIRRSFKDVAERFGLTPENAPSHPSNCRKEWIEKDMERGVTYFAIETLNKVAGCVAFERADSDVCYLERLAVLPDRRRKGLGEALVAHVLSEARHLGAHRVSMGIIAEHIELKDWYKRIGFIEGETRDFSHLPFRVAFMSCEIGIAV